MLSKETISVAERRRHPRTQVNMSVRCIRLDPDGGDVVDNLEVLDISRGGIGALSDRSLYPGQRLIVRVPHSGDGEFRSINATVVRCRHRNEGYRVGLMFESTALGAFAGGLSMRAAA